ncbi:MAG: hypothetical protein M3219_03785, partial [Thermoproteota archaeon]|nr:hypothetical protein [Thermoproteota archaeon]
MHVSNPGLTTLIGRQQHSSISMFHYHTYRFYAFKCKLVFRDTYSIKQEGASCVQSILRLIVALQQRKSIVIVLQLKSEIVAGQS